MERKYCRISAKPRGARDNERFYNKERLPKGLKGFGFAALLTAIFISSCPTTETTSQQTQQPAQQQPAQDAPQPPPSPSNPYFSGLGGKGMSLAVLLPETKGLTADQNYLPALAQGVFVGDFTKYSALSVLDRQNLDKMFAETLDPVYVDDNPDVIRLGRVTHTDYIMTGSITKTGAGYALQMQIADTKEGITKASYTGNCAVAEFDNFTGIRKASAELLAQMGIALTDKAKQELAAAAESNAVKGQTALAQGITAQQKGTEVTALTYYYQAATYDPSLLEAVNRQSVTAANISSGNIGSDVRNDIQWRKDWIARLTETEQYFDNLFKNSSPLYGLFYLTALERGKVDYRTETVPLSFQVNLHAFSEWFDLIPLKTLETVRDGLNATKRKDEWGIKDWPLHTITNLNPFQDQWKGFEVVFELLNENGKVIGRQSLTLWGVWSFDIRSKKFSVSYNENNFQTVNFNAVNANDITDKLSIRVASVNGVDAQTVTKNGDMRIAALSEFPTAYEFSKGVITKYNGPGGNIVIDTIWGEPVKGIGYTVFNRKNLTSVTIPNSVTSIEYGAFLRNQLTSVTIPNSVTSIEGSVFFGNQLTSLTIPNSVTSIGSQAFYGNQLTSVIIPDSVTSIGSQAFASNQLTSVIIPDSVTSIKWDAFSGNPLKSISIGNGITFIEDKAFYDYRLASVIIGNNVTSIGKNAFEDNQLTTVTIPNSVTSIGSVAFYSNRLTSVIIGNSVTSIGSESFRYNELTSVTIPNSVTAIEMGAFANNWLTSVTIPNSVTYIGWGAFANNPLTSVTIGVNVDSGPDGIPNGFFRFYEKNGKKAGVYSYSRKSWSYKPQ